MGAGGVAGGGSSPPQVARWVTHDVGVRGTNVALHEVVKASNAVVGREVVMRGEEGEVVLPLTVYPRQYFAIQGKLRLGKLRLEGAEGMELSLHVPARSALVTMTRWVEATRDVPAFPQEAAERARWAELTELAVDGAWFENGHLVEDAEGVAMERWLRDAAAMEGVRAGGLLWYPLRFGRDGRYQLREQVDGEGRKEMGVLRVVGI